MSTQNNPPSYKRSSTANPPASTPANYSHQDHSVTLQMLMELQKSTGQIAESIAQLDKRVERSEDKSEARFNSLESAMSDVKLKIGIAVAVLAIVMAVSGFFINKAWDAIADRVEISIKK
jgi:hypothetical protein